jgi:hypothetical protein
MLSHSSQLQTKSVIGLTWDIPMKQKLLNVTIGIILFFLFSELFALGWYFLSSWYTLGHGEFFYLSDKPQHSIGEVASEELISDFRLHPYFGFVGKPSLARNNHGFIFPSYSTSYRRDHA